MLEKFEFYFILYTDIETAESIAVPIDKIKVKQTTVKGAPTLMKSRTKSDVRNEKKTKLEPDRSG